MAASAPRKAPVRKPAANKGLVLDRAENRTVVDALVADREPLFTIGRKTYTIPKKVPPSWTMQAFTVASEQGEKAALVFAASKLLEPDAWAALEQCDTLTQADLLVIFKAITDRILPDGAFVPKA